MGKAFNRWFANPRLYTTVLGIVVMGFGLYTHFESAWSKPTYNPYFPSAGPQPIRPDELCELRRQHGNIDKNKPCPSLALEHYFISVIIICFILSCFGLAASWLVDLESKRTLRNIDLGYHALATILLLIAGILYIVSAEQINYHFEGRDNRNQYKRTEKLIAGALTIFQALLNLLVAFKIARQ